MVTNHVSGTGIGSIEGIMACLVLEDHFIKISIKYRTVDAILVL